MKKPWFKQIYWLYYPVSWQGVVLVIFAIAFCLQLFIVLITKSNSINSTLYGIIPYIIAVFLLLSWIAAKTSK